MTERKFSMVVDLVGTKKDANLEEKLIKGRERNLHLRGNGYVRNSRDFEFRYTKHCDARRAGERAIKLLTSEGVKNFAVYLVDRNGEVESMTSYSVPTQPTTQKNTKWWNTWIPHRIKCVIGGS